MTRISNSEPTTEQCLTGLRVAINILHKWRTSDEQACRILHVSRHTYIRAQQCDPAWSVALDTGQMQRISLVLNIHAALRLTFENPKNTYGFVSMPNDNDFFNGRSPLEVMSQGDLNSLEETYRRIDVLLLGPHGQQPHKPPSLQEMIAQCNLAAPPSTESIAWEAAPAIGLEFGAEALSENLRAREKARRSALWSLQDPAFGQRVHALKTLQSIAKLDQEFPLGDGAGLTTADLRTLVRVIPKSETMLAHVIEDEIPQPWRERFIAASIGSTKQQVDTAYAHDWQSFLALWDKEYGTRND